jgi:GT2 family glycosyltransferase
MSRRQAEVSVLVLSWNGRQHLEHCLEALEKQRDPGVVWETLVLDNGSTDGTADWVRERHPEVRLVPSAENLGFCAGNNRLAELALGDALVLLNNDARPEPGWLAALVDAWRGAPPVVAAIAGRIVDWEGERLDFGYGVRTFDGHAFQLDFRRPLAAARLPGANEELAFPCGGNMLIRKRSFFEAGAFDARYFAYLEDVDLGWRLWSGGERVVACPDAVVRHRSAATSDRLGLFDRGFLFERNALLTAYTNYDEELWPLLMPSIWLAFLSRVETLVVAGDPAAGELRRDPFRATGARSKPSPAPPIRQTLGEKLRQHGAPELARRGVRKLGRKLAGASGAPAAGFRVDHPQAVAHLRAMSLFLGALDESAARRSAVQARRKVPDREILARFPPYLVATYPGDERLFASPGFTSFLPRTVPFVRATLDEIMELAPAHGAKNRGVSSKA